MQARVLQTPTVSFERRRQLAHHEREALASCSGFVVVASDGRVGEVEMPLFPPDSSEPDYLVLRSGGFLSLRRPLVATELVEEVDSRRKRVRVRGSRSEIESLPERIPLAI